MRPLEYPPTIPNLIRNAAQQFPERDYVVTPGERLTFAEADTRSRQVAKRLLRCGVSKGTHVGILFPQGPDFVVAFLAATRIGAVTVPLSTFLREPELRRAVRHVDIDTLIAPRMLRGRDLQPELEELLPELARAGTSRFALDDAPFLRRVCLAGGGDRPWVTAMPPFSALADEPGISEELLSEVERKVTPADWMVMIYTSGATAEPKAVVHAHAAQVRQAWKLAQLYELTDSVRTFTTMPFFWVGGLTITLLTHLVVGAAVITIERTDSGAMLDLIEKARPTRLVGWGIAERLRADPTFAGRDLSWLAELQSPIEPGRRHGSLGMTETCGPHTAMAASDNQIDLPDEQQGSFGPPIAGMQHKIIDPESGVTLAAGIKGEICVRGDCLMEAIYKQERAQTFDEDGWYHTGDRGFLRDGLLYFTGRFTEMIKTSGANVAPREVELAVESLAGVRVAFVVGIPDAQRGEVVGCLICPEEGNEIVPLAVTEQLSALLSSYKIPRRMLVLPYEDAPWFPSGKINKARIVELLEQP